MKERKQDPRRQDKRNEDILNRVQAGEPAKHLANEYGLGVNRVYQIIQREQRFIRRP